MATTTIKVPAELRDRINRDARSSGLTAAGLIEKLLDEHERAQMLDAFGRSFATADAGYRAEAAAWSAMEADLPGE